MTTEVLSGVAVWKWLTGAGMGIAAFFGANWVYTVNKKLEQVVTREELAEHLDKVVSVVTAEAEKSRAELEKMILQSAMDIRLKVESQRHDGQNNKNS